MPRIPHRTAPVSTPSKPSARAHFVRYSLPYGRSRASPFIRQESKLS
ncbi:hypothetical protein [Halococcus thailandensis]|nr:hypothetical protein [Halococcus thailandensis]